MNYFDTIIKKNYLQYKMLEHWRVSLLTKVDVVFKKWTQKYFSRWSCTKFYQHGNFYC